MGHAPTPSTPDEMDEHDVFLSYSRADTKTMVQVKADLEAEELSVWIDQTGIPPGTPDWERAIENAIKACDCMVVVLSPDAYESPWVRAETHFAKAHRKSIFPILARGSEQTSVPLNLIYAQWIDIRDVRHYRGSMQRLVNEICNHLGKESLSQQRARLATEKARREAAEAARRKAPAEEARRVAAEDARCKAAEDEPRRKAAEEAAKRQRQAEREQWAQKAPPTPSPTPIQQQHRNTPPRSTSQPPKPKPTQPQLNHLNPLDWLRVLWWMLIAPANWSDFFINDEAILKKTTAGLKSTLSWLPLALLATSGVIGTLPIEISVDRPLGMMAALFMIWAISLATRRLEFNEISGDGTLIFIFYIAFVIAAIVAAGVTVGTAGGVALAVVVSVAAAVAGVMTFGVVDDVEIGATAVGALGMAIGMFVGVSEDEVSAITLAGAFVTAGAMAIIIQYQLESGRPTIYGKAIFLALILSYAVLIYHSFLGGYRVLP